MKDFFGNLIKEVKRSIARFFTTFCLTVLLFLVCGYVVVFESSSELSERMIQIALTISFGILLCTLGKILFEKYGERIIKDKRPFIEIGLVLLSSIAYPLLDNYQNNQYVSASYGGIMLALFMSVIYFTNIENISKTFSYIFKNTIFNGLACFIVTLGTSLSIFAFCSLIYEFENSYKLYLVNAMFIWIILFLNLSLSTIPHKSQTLKIPNLFMVIVMYIALPVYLLLITILYAYLGKILIKFDFPSGQINWFASFASLLFVFFLLALDQYKHENKLAKIFVKFGGYVMIPIIIMQFIAMYIRLSHYGLTTSRYISLILNIIAFIFMIASLMKDGKYVKQMLIVVAGVSLLLTITPLNLYDVPFWEQTTRLTRVLNQNNMIIDEKIVANGDISKEDKIKITSSYNYLKGSHTYGEKKKLPNIISNTDETEFNLIFGFSQEYEQDDLYDLTDNYGEFTYEYDFIDVAEYSKVYTISAAEYENNRSKKIKLNVSGKTINYDIIKKEIESLYFKYGTGTHKVKMEFQIANDRVILTNTSFDIDENNQLYINWLDGYFLEK